MLGYKWTAASGPIYGTGTYDLSGGWNELAADVELVPCSSGYHFCRAEDASFWCGTELWQIEVDESAGMLNSHGKSLCRRWRVVKRLRWDRADMLAYAWWCAKRAKGHHASDEVSAAAAANCAAAAASASARYAESAADVARHAALHAAAAAAAAVNCAARYVAGARYASERAEQRRWIEARIGERLV